MLIHELFERKIVQLSFFAKQGFGEIISVKSLSET